MFCFAQWLLRSCPTAVQEWCGALQKQSASHCRGTKDPVQPVAVLTISGTLSLTTGAAQWLKYQLQQETRCSQSQGKEVHRLKSLCHLTGKPKSSPQAHLRLQSIAAGRRAGHSCHLSTPCCCKAAQGPSPAGLGGPKEPLEWVQTPHKPHPLAEQGAAGAQLTSAASHKAGKTPKATVTAMGTASTSLQ